MENEVKNLKCPDCGNDLGKVAAETQYGVKMRLDQCENCGGIWFDSLELYPISRSEIAKLENIRLDKLRESKYLGDGSGLCPKCDDKLQDFRDINFPKTLEVEMCPKCGGIWMNRGEATEFKKWQEEKKKSAENPGEKDKEFEAKIKDLLEQYRDRDLEKISAAGKMLSMKIDRRTLRPLNAEDYGAGEYNKARDTAAAAIGILYLLLRLFLKL